MNKCIFLGRTTRDMEIRYSGEMAIGKVTLAVDVGHGERKKASFFRLTAFGKTAESFAKYITKGRKVLVTCYAQQETWKDKDGGNREAVGFTIQEWEFADKAEQAAQPAPAATVPDGFDVAFDDDLPFN